MQPTQEQQVPPVQIALICSRVQPGTLLMQDLQHPLHKGLYGRAPHGQDEASPEVQVVGCCHLRILESWGLIKWATQASEHWVYHPLVADY
jgi:hypothetical protein